MGSIDVYDSGTWKPMPRAVSFHVGTERETPRDTSTAMPDHTILRRTTVTMDVRIAFPDGEGTVPFMLADNDQWTPVRKSDADELRELLGRHPLFELRDDRLLPDGLPVSPQRDWSLAPLDEVDWPIGRDRPTGAGVHLGSVSGTLTIDLDDLAQALAATAAAMTASMAHIAAAMQSAAAGLDHVTARRRPSGSAVPP